jgi:hypothetical protein
MPKSLAEAERHATIVQDGQIIADKTIDLCGFLI